jgi:hypothetical protein
LFIKQTEGIKRLKYLYKYKAIVTWLREEVIRIGDIVGKNCKILKRKKKQEK